MKINKKWYLKPVRDFNEWLLEHKDSDSLIKWALFFLIGTLSTCYHIPLIQLMKTSLILTAGVMVVSVFIGIVVYIALDYINTVIIVCLGTLTEPFRIKYDGENEKIERIAVRYKKYIPSNIDISFTKKDIFRYLFVMAVLTCIFKFILMLCIIPSKSMENTLLVDDILIATKHFEEIERYDIIAFEYPDDPSELFIKRAIGLPGETVEITNGHVYVNGTMISEEYIKEDMTEGLGDGVYKVPENHYFMLGDNRNNSNDSRFWIKMYVPRENIKSKALIKIYKKIKILETDYK